MRQIQGEEMKWRSKTVVTRQLACLTLQCGCPEKAQLDQEEYRHYNEVSVTRSRTTARSGVRVEVPIAFCESLILTAPVWQCSAIKVMERGAELVLGSRASIPLAVTIGQERDRAANTEVAKSICTERSNTGRRVARHSQQRSLVV